MYGEFLQSTYRYYANINKHEMSIKMAEKLCEIFSAEFGEENDLYCDALYLKSKSTFRCSSLKDLVNAQMVG